MSDLVASPAPDPTQPFKGISAMETGYDLAQQFSEGNWVQGSLSIVGAGLEVAGAALDPVGYLFSTAASFLIEHFEPLTEVLDKLTGKPELVAAHAQTWSNMAERFNTLATELDGFARELSSEWVGDAKDGYLTTMDANVAGTAALAGAAAAMAAATQGAGTLVAVTRELVRDMIAEAVGQAISILIELVFPPLVLAKIPALILKWTGRIHGVITDLFDSLMALKALLGV
jgi:uncharacterized protein YukE